MTKNVAGSLIVRGKRKNVFEIETNSKYKYVYVIGIIAIVVIGFGSIPFIIRDILDENVFMKWFLLGSFIFATGFYSFVEWKFLKDSKEYIVSLITMAVE